MDLASWKEPITRVVEVVGVLLILGGAATFRSVREFSPGSS
jgi:hypothetical protein